MSEILDPLGEALLKYQSEIESGLDEINFHRILGQIRDETHGGNPQLIESALVVPTTVDRRLLVLRRSNSDRQTPNGLCFPGGKKDKGDKNFINTAMRELREEIGIQLTPSLLNERDKKTRTVKVGTKGPNTYRRIYEINVFDAELPFSYEELQRAIEFKPNEEDFFEHNGYWLIESGHTEGLWVPFDETTTIFGEGVIASVPINDSTGHFTKSTLEKWMMPR